MPKALAMSREVRIVMALMRRYGVNELTFTRDEIEANNAKLLRVTVTEKPSAVKVSIYETRPTAKKGAAVK